MSVTVDTCLKLQISICLLTKLYSNYKSLVFLLKNFNLLLKPVEVFKFMNEVQINLPFSVLVFLLLLCVFLISVAAK